VISRWRVPVLGTTLRVQSRVDIHCRPGHWTDSGLLVGLPIYSDLQSALGSLYRLFSAFEYFCLRSQQSLICLRGACVRFVAYACRTINTRHTLSPNIAFPPDFIRNHRLSSCSQRVEDTQVTASRNIEQASRNRIRRTPRSGTHRERSRSSHNRHRLHRHSQTKHRRRLEGE
jgi:hypothetical protein